MRCFYILALLLCCNVIALLYAPASFALDEFEYRDDSSPWVLRARIGLASPDYSETYTPAGDVSDGNKDIFSSALLIDGDVSYQFTPHFSFAASLGYAAQEKEDIFITTSSGSLTVGDNAKVTLLPTTFMLRFHPAPYGKLNPYLGVGWGYIFGFTTFSGAEMSNGGGIALQAGFDYWFDNQFMFNLDVKQITSEIEVDFTDSFSGVPVKGTYTYDPMLISAGVGVRF